MPPWPIALTMRYGPKRELRAAFFQLLDLPAIQIAEVDQPLAEQFVADWFGRDRGTGVACREPGEGIIDLLLREKPAGERRVAENRMRRGSRHSFDPLPALPRRTVKSRLKSYRPAKPCAKQAIPRKTCLHRLRSSIGPPASTAATTPAAVLQSLICILLTGCSMTSRRLCRAIPGENGRVLPYFRSPTIGKPACESCTRIWCLRPVSSCTSSSESAAF